VSGEGIHALERFDGAVLVLEALAIVALLASLGRIAMMVWLNGWGVLLAVMVLGGVALPIFMQWRWPARGSMRPLLVLLGGLILRAVIVLSSDGLS
jgi:hypothetical protein